MSETETTKETRIEDREMAQRHLDEKRASCDRAIEEYRRVRTATDDVQINVRARVVAETLADFLDAFEVYKKTLKPILLTPPTGRHLTPKAVLGVASFEPETARGESPSGVPATLSTLALLRVIQDVSSAASSRIPITAIIRAYERFQEETGAIVYGSLLNRSRTAIEEDLRSDLAVLVEKRLVDVADDAVAVHFGVFGIRLAEPLDKLPDFLRDALSGHV